MKLLNQLQVLKPWQLSYSLTPTRTVGQILLRKNCTQVDIWIRVNGKPTRFSVNRQEIINFLCADNQDVILSAESDNNAELWYR